MVQDTEGHAPIIEWLITDDDIVPSPTEADRRKRWLESDEHKALIADIDRGLKSWATEFAQGFRDGIADSKARQTR